MNAVLIVLIVFGGSILALAIVGGIILAAIKIIKEGFSSKDRKWETEEARMIQEIYQGLSGMEQRVEALETILLERKGKDGTT